MTIHFQSTPADYREAIRGHARAFPSTDAADGFRRLIQEWADGQSLGFPVITPAPSNN